MNTTIDKAGRVVIPAAVRARLGLDPGTELEVIVEDFSVRLVRVGPRPEIVQKGKRITVRPTASEKERPPIDFAKLVEEERDRWP